MVMIDKQGMLLHYPKWSASNKVGLPNGNNEAFMSDGEWYIEFIGDSSSPESKKTAVPTGVNRTDYDLGHMFHVGMDSGAAYPTSHPHLPPNSSSASHRMPPHLPTPSHASPTHLPGMGGMYPCRQSPHWTKDPVTGFWSGEKPISNTKVNGATAGKVPVGDGYDVDFVAHEFSHQFGTSHTWSGKGSSCSPSNFMAKSAMEIGAGSTLVTYAGICDDDNIQMRSDPYFHVYNLNEFQENYFQSNVQIMDDVNMQTCGTRTEITNERPTANVPATCAIPKQTPFFLQGSGTDPNAADVLAYTWEQVDPAEFAESMSIGFKKGPLFRSVPPSANGFLRNFPNMTAAIVPKGWETPWPGERLPFTARDIHFAMTVRDNYMAAKPTLASQDLTYGSWHAAITKVNVVDLGPMLVEQPAAGASVPAGITLVTFKLDGYKNPAASPGLDDVKGAKFTFEVTTNGGLAWTDLVRSQHLVKLNNKGEGSAYVVLPTSLVGSTVAQIRVVADMAKVPGQTTTGCAFWAPSGRFTVTAARSVPTVATTNPAAAATVPATISAISFGFSAPVFHRTAATPVATVAVASGTPTTITLSLFEDGASTANFAFPSSLTFTAGSTYTVTVPAGYFHDGLGNNLAEFTSTFTIASRRALNEFSDELTLSGFTPPAVEADLTWGTGYASAAKSIDHAAPAFTAASTIRANFSRAIRIPDDSDKVISIDELCDEGWGSCWESYSASEPYCALPLIATDEDGEKITNPDIDVDGAQLLISPNENCPLYAGGQFRLKIPADAIFDMAETAMTTESAYYYFNTIPDTTPPTLQECPEAGAKWGATDVDESQPLVLCFNEEACDPPHTSPASRLVPCDLT